MEKITPEDLKQNKISRRQQAFAIHFVTKGENASEAYRISYNAYNMKPSSVWVEASKLLKHPKVTLWIDYYRQNQKESIEENFRYTQAQAFHEINEMITVALEEKGKSGTPNLSVIAKFVDMKNRLAGNYEKDNQQKNENTVINVIRPEVQGE